MSLHALTTQKPDPVASKELALITLTRIYTLLQPFPTLVREFATPTLPAFATGCLQLIRSSGSGKVPMSAAETATRALAALIPLYPTTLRPFAAQIRTAIAAFIAPTSSDDIVVPLSLRRSSRQLLILLHYTAAKNSNSDEWLKALNSLIREAHQTADQVFRAVREARDPGSSYEPGQVSFEGEPSGGGNGENPEDLPAWSGLQSGSERLCGLVETIMEFFHCSSKLPVAVPIGVISGLVSRISVILAPSPSDVAQGRDLASFINPNIGRDEREELWSLLPNIHIAALALLSSMVKRMGGNIVPLVPEILEEVMRMFKSNRHIPCVRKTTFIIVRDTLPLVGPSLSKLSVDSLIAVIRVCCQDILESTGHLKPQKKPEEKPVQTGTNGANSRSKMTAIANADLFLKPGVAANSAVQPSKTDRLETAHLDAAETLLTASLSYVPQQHVKKADRALMDRTAILSANKGAMVSSVLQPYVDNSGRYFANTVPFLARAYPHDIDMEVLRSNLRTVPHYFGNIFSSTIPGEDDENEDDEDEDEDANNGQAGAADEDEPMSEAAAGDAASNGAKPTSQGGFGQPAVFTERSKPAATDASATPAFQPLTLKRKSNEAEAAAVGTPKRLDTGKAPAAAALEEDSGDESDGSVQLEMVFDVDDESGDEN